MSRRAALLLAAAAATACARAGTPGVTDGEVVFGITAPLTGPAAAWSAVSQGAAAWAAHVNAGGGVHGRRLRVLIRDDGYVPARALANLVEMKDSTFAAVTLAGTAAAAAVKDVPAESGLPLVFPTGNVRIWARLPRDRIARVFVVYPDYRTEGAFIGRAIVAHTPARRVAAFYQNDDFGRDGIEGLKRGLAEAGAALVAEVPYELQDREMGLHALKMKASGADAAVLYGTPTHAANLVKEMSRSGYRPALFASFVLSDAQVMFRLVGELWSGVYFASWHEVPGEPGADQVGAAIVAQDASLRGRESFASLGGAAMMLAVEGLRRAGRDLSREGFVSALETIDDWTPELGFRVRFGPGRRHSGNRLRLLRTGASAREVAVVSGYQEFEPLF